MKKYLVLVLLCLSLCACGKSPTANTKFINEFNTFCTNVSDIDASINKLENLQADEEGVEKATETLMNYLDMLDDEFRKLSNIDFPEEYDTLEPLADEASEYMTEAVRSYRIAYEDEYSESMEEYAGNNYSRAYKRVQYMINILNGTSDDNQTTTQ